MIRLPLAVLVIAGLLPTSVGVAADDTDADSVAALEAQLRNAEEKINALSTRVEELELQTGDRWLTKARAREIRGMVEDILADADTRSSLLQNGITAGWSNGFFLADTNGRFRLDLDGLIQFRYVHSWLDDQVPGDPNRGGFENTRTRLTFSGHIFGPDLQYLVRGGFNRGDTDQQRDDDGTFQLLDAWGRYILNDYWSVRFGQFKLPFMRETLVLPQHLLTVERSLVNQTLTVGRSQGVELTYADDFNRVSVMVSDGATEMLAGTAVAPGTLIPGTGINSPWEAADTEWAFTGRYERLIAGGWEQFRDFTSPPGDEFGLLWGAAFHAQRGEFQGTVAQPPFGFIVQADDDTNWLNFTTDLSAEWGGANAFASLNYSQADLDAFPAVGLLEQWGVVVQGGYYLTPKTEVFGRFEFESWEADIEFEDLYVLTGGMNWYIDGHDVKFTADASWGISPVRTVFVSPIAGYQADQEGVDDQIVFRLQMQLLF